MIWVELMKGICHIWSRGRLISPSLPVGDDWYLNLNSQKRPPGRNLGEHRLVRRSGTASRGTVVISFCLRMRTLPKAKAFTIFVGNNIDFSKSLKWVTLCKIFFNIKNETHKKLNCGLYFHHSVRGQELVQCDRLVKATKSGTSPKWRFPWTLITGRSRKIHLQQMPLWNRVLSLAADYLQNFLHLNNASLTAQQ